MGGKYEVRYDVKGESEYMEYQSEYLNNFFKFIAVLFKHRKKLIYFRVNFY